MGTPFWYRQVSSHYARKYLSPANRPFTPHVYFCTFTKCGVFESGESKNRTGEVWLQLLFFTLFVVWCHQVSSGY